MCGALRCGELRYSTVGGGSLFHAVQPVFVHVGWRFIMPRLPMMAPSSHEKKEQKKNSTPSGRVER